MSATGLFNSSVGLPDNHRIVTLILEMRRSDEITNIKNEIVFRAFREISISDDFSR